MVRACGRWRKRSPLFVASWGGPPAHHELASDREPLPVAGRCVRCRRRLLSGLSTPTRLHPGHSPDHLQPVLMALPRVSTLMSIHQLDDAGTSCPTSVAALASRQGARPGRDGASLP